MKLTLMYWLNVFSLLINGLLYAFNGDNFSLFLAIASGFLAVSYLAVDNS